MQPRGGDRSAIAIFSARIARLRFMRLLTEEQEAVVAAVTEAVQRSTGEHFVLQAVAGSGKTFTVTSIVQRILGLIPLRDPEGSVRPYHGPTARILVLQFNRETCEQMRQRLHSEPVDVYTIHAYAPQLISHTHTRVSV